MESTTSPSPSPTPLPLSLAPQIATYSIQDPAHPEIEEAQVSHRIRLVNAWAIPPGARVLELGCGQGTATAVLAEAVGETGHVDAVDPAAPDYGAPFTLAQAQAHLSASPVGNRISWHQASPQDFLRQPASNTDRNGVWDVAVLAHCIWYFASERELGDILTALRGRVKTLCIAEYALHATEKSALPHVLAVLARGALESCKEDSTENVRSLLSPVAIKEVASRCGWECAKESTLVPELGLLDGSWEVGSVMSRAFLREVDEAVENHRLRVVVRSARDAVGVAVAALNGEKVGTMDVWAASFGPLAS
ncbi:SAM-dependent methyltransferase [Xylaria bambusicola]|uniref:SAM-dependent methyltransferase n=1 Tax=Xylaria bambusicola TaxID=326684 RepID=UPI002008C4EC|nr:SAM-dependent methyltransferase [Xylaria bambusicola]KAI0503091.1 SAM-dependent methyltransferase [Xylaria bambusicola]